MASVLLGVTGGIAAYKACELCRLLVRAGHEVTPILTPDAERFVSALTFAALARREAASELYPHLLRADLFVIAPVSANTLAKLAVGLADNVLTQTALAFGGTLLVAPAMNTRMWEHPATRENVTRLRERGVELVGPEVGELAEGEIGAGRMAEPETIFTRCRELLTGVRGPLDGRRVLVTAGGTREPLDSVRFVGNRSSGRMGLALAAEAARRGADVTLVTANVSLQVPSGVAVVPVSTASEVARETLARASADVVLMAAAVADYRPVERLEHKREKDADRWAIELEPTQDILSELGRGRRPGQVLVGFAADEGEGGLERAKAKRERKAVNLFVFNDVSRSDVGFESEDNELVILSKRGEHVVGKRSKEECAMAILDEVTEELEGA